MRYYYSVHWERREYFASSVLAWQLICSRLVVVHWDKPSTWVVPGQPEMMKKKLRMLGKTCIIFDDQILLVATKKERKLWWIKKVLLSSVLGKRGRRMLLKKEGCWWIGQRFHEKSTRLIMLQIGRFGQNLNLLWPTISGGPGGWSSVLNSFSLTAARES